MTKLLFVSPVAYDALWQRHQSLATELAKHEFHVIFLDPLCSGGLGLSQQIVSDHFKVIRIKVPFKGVSYPGLQKIASRICVYLLKNRLGLLPKTTILWLSEPSLASLSARKWQQVVYDRCDLHGEFPGQRKQAWEFYESLLFARSDLICISHPFLRPTIAQQDKIILVQNAGTAEFANHKPVARHQQQKVQIVSSGAHFEWVDMKWLIELATCDSVRLHIAGSGRGEQFERLLRQPSVKYHKSLNKSELGNLLQRCHVGVVPFADLPLIRGVDPIKVYEYAQLKLHVWSPPLEALSDSPLIGARLANKAQMQKAINNLLNSGFKTPKHQDVPVWADRIASALDRLTYLSSN